MQRKSLKGKPVLVLWDDAWQSGDYFNFDEIAVEDAKPVESYGLVIRDDKGGIAIAMDDLRGCGDGRFRDVKFIPRGMVRKVKVLR